MLTTKFRHVFPGFGLGVVLFGLYLAGSVIRDASHIGDAERKKAAQHH
jgi:hypothetical protein